MPQRMIVDAHLDISWNAIAEGSGFTVEPAPGHLISRSRLVAAGVGLVFATVYCAPQRARKMLGTDFLYATPREAALVAQAQLGYYRSVGLDFIRTPRQLVDYATGWRRGQLAAVLLMEGADPVETPSKLGQWAKAGIRIIGPAWSKTRYSGGTGSPGGLSALGFELLRAMKRQRLILDISHMADRAVADAFEAWDGPIMSSHSDARALTPGDRQITDSTAAEIGHRGGVLGVSFYRGHLRQSGKATIADVIAHIRHLAGAAGGPEHIGLGTDLDGGFMAADSPIDDLSGLAELRTRLGKDFSASQVAGVMGENWIEFLKRSLPGS